MSLASLLADIWFLVDSCRLICLFRTWALFAMYDSTY